MAEKSHHHKLQGSRCAVQTNISLNSVTVGLVVKEFRLFNFPFQAKSNFIIESYLFHDGFCLMVLCLATGKTREETETHTNTGTNIVSVHDVILTFR